MQHALRGLVVVAAMAGCVLIAGCPAPLFTRGYEPASRGNVPAGQPEWIVPGTTSREEILLRLGTPDRQAPDGRWFGYVSSRHEGGIAFVIPGGQGGVISAETYTERRLVVWLDEHGIVTKTQFTQKECPRLGFNFDVISEHCLGFADLEEPAAATTARDDGSAGTPRAGGPFETVVIRILPTDIVEWPLAPIGAQLEVIDRRTRIILERTTIGMPMSAVMLQPREIDLIRLIIAAKLKEAIQALEKPMSVRTVTCELTEFSITTPGTLLYWDVTADIAVTLGVGNRRRSLTAHKVARTYFWPSELILTTVTADALKVIAIDAGPALRELIASEPEQ
jgi:outer membrane protein assembly factor BamE (lipoprotein component of BamABCDE complex)